MKRSYDVIILGAGFSGCLLGLILTKLGQSVLIIDRQKHPRFAIGESSTPAADFILESLCDRYDLDQVRPICRYGSWVNTYPEISRGLKRGFSYFHHRHGEPFQSGIDHARELLVAASVTNDVGDTHWFRADVDAFLAREYVAAGGTLWEETIANIEGKEAPWTIVPATSSGQNSHPPVHGIFLVDATGGDSALVNHLQLTTRANELCTNTRSLFGHFQKVHEWGRLMDLWGFSREDHPYPCDLAALHHVIPGGWMWVLRFDHGVTSVGWSLDPVRHPLRNNETPLQEWNRLREDYPSIAVQLHDAKPVDPFSIEYPVWRTGRLQRIVTPASGADWALLPHTAGFIDPLFSTGIAHSLLGVERLAEILGEQNSEAARIRQLGAYARILEQETRLIDRIVSLAIETMGSDPRQLHAAAMVYFAAATTFEQRRLTSNAGAFLLADDVEFVQAVDNIRNQWPGAGANEHAVERWVRAVESQLSGWNSVGLFHPSRPGMYTRTSTK